MKKLSRLSVAVLIYMGAGVAFDSHAAAATATPSDGSVLPFPPVPSASKAAPRLQDSVHKRRAEPQHLKPGAPNVLIILLDDVGFGQASTFGGEMNTPALTKLASQGISYNTFHTTAICSPTRAALLTGRNHQRVGNGTIAERAVDWDGYTGVIPKTSATMAEVLRHYGYRTAAFGKWHNTPANQTTAMGPFDRWPTGHGFDYFYGFLAGETSQWEPRLVENTTAIEPPHDEKYHLSEDMAARGIDWLRKHRSFAPDKPFFMYWAPGAAHGPHQVGKEWSGKYKGKFDTGWNAYRERVFARQKQLGWIPADTKLTPRAANMPSWDSIPESQRPFQLRLMEIYAGFVEHVDAQAGKLIDELDRLGIRDNTIVIYIFGDNGASAEGQNGTISELLAQNGIPNTVEQQIAALEKIGGLDALGGPKTDSMYHAGLGVGRQHAVPPHQAGRIALRRHPQSDGHLVAEGHQGRQDAARAVPPRQRHRAYHLRDRRHQAAEGGRWIRAGPDRWREPRLHLHRRQGAHAQKGRSTSTTTAAVPSIRTAGWRRPSVR